MPQAKTSVFTLTTFSTLEVFPKTWCTRLADRVLHFRFAPLDYSIFRILYIGLVTVLYKQSRLKIFNISSPLIMCNWKYTQVVNFGNFGLFFAYSALYIYKKKKKSYMVFFASVLLILSTTLIFVAEKQYLRLTRKRISPGLAASVHYANINKVQYSLI